MDPDSADVLNYLAFGWADRGQHVKQATEMLQKAVSLSPQSGAIIDSLGWAYYRGGDYRQAVRELERAVMLEAADPDVNDHLGDAYWRVGRKLEARYQWRQVLTLGPSDQTRATVEAKIKAGLPDIPAGPRTEALADRPGPGIARP
jgi:Flp pilus assembly protein TadD